MQKELNTLLINQCKQGNPEAFNLVYQTCAKGVYNTIYRIVNNKEEAEDLLQDTFMSAFSKIENYRGDASLFGWIKTIGVNKSLNSVKKKKLQFSDLEIENEGFIDDNLETWDSIGVDAKKVLNGINRLPEGYRLVLTLYLFEDYSHRQIAEELGISESTSKTQYTRGKQKLKELLS